MAQSRNKVLGLLLALSVLASGIAIGAAAMGFYVRNRIELYFSADSPGRKDPVLAMITREVGTDEAKSALIGKLMNDQKTDAKFAYLRALSLANEPKYRLFEKIEAALTPEEVKRFRTFLGGRFVKHRPAVIGDVYVQLQLSPAQLEQFESLLARAAVELPLKGLSEKDGGWLVVNHIAPQMEGFLSAEQREILQRFLRSQPAAGAGKKD